MRSEDVEVETDLERYVSSLRTGSSAANRAEHAAGIRPASFLDARPLDAFICLRVANSAHVSLEDIRSAGAHTLPPRTTPFAIVASTKEEAIELARFLRRGDFKGVGWSARGAFAGDEHFFRECEKIDRQDEIDGLHRYVRLARGEPRADERLRLWEPSRDFARWLPEVERRLLPKTSERLTCVDFGSGSGRDAVWAASRGWNVIAIDNDARGLARCAQLASFHGVDEHVRPLCVDLRKSSSESVFDSIESLISCESWADVSLAYAVRYLHKPLFRDFNCLLPHRCAVMIFHFMRGCENSEVGRPTKDRDLLEIGELRDAFSAQDWTTVVNEVVHLPDGRPISAFVTFRAS